MTNRPSNEIAGEAFENQSADIQLAAIKGTAEIVSAFLQKSPSATLSDTKDLISHVGQTFKAYLTTSAAPPVRGKPGPKPKIKDDVAAAQQALGAAISQVDRKREPPTQTQAQASEPRGRKTRATKTIKKPKGKGKGQFAEIITDFDDFEEANLSPAVAVDKSITPDAIICLHTGQGFKMMKSHLYNLGYKDTATQTAGDRYREFWKLPQDYPLVAPNYSKKRRSIAKNTITGRRPGPKLIMKRADEITDENERNEYLLKTTVTPNYLVSMIDGSKQKQLDLHVENNGMSWDQYLAKFKLPADYPKDVASAAAGQNAMTERLTERKIG